MVVYTVYADDILIHHSESSSPEVKLITPKLSMEENSSGSFTFTVPPSNIGYNYITRITTEIIVKRQTVDSQTGLLGKEKEIWSGRVIDEKTDFYNNRQLTCEGALSYLNDTIQPQAKYERYTPASMLTTLINNHNDKSVPFVKKGLTIIFDSKCKTENSFDYVRIYYRNSSNTYDYIQCTNDFGGRELNIPSNDFYLYWHADSSINNFYGYKIESISPYSGSDYTTKTSTVSTLPNYTVVTVGLNNLPESDHSPYQNGTDELYFVQTGFGRAFDHDFKVGAVTVQDPDPSVGYTTYETNFESTMDCINNKLLNTCGGHLVLRRNETDGYNYIDYLEEYTKLNNQTIEFGKNLLDFSKSFDISSICTVLLPLGERLEGKVDDDMDSYLTVESVNSGNMYVINQEALNTFGWIEKCVHFDDIEDPTILLRRAQRYLQDTQYEQMTLELNAIDLHYLGVDDGELFELYDRVHCTSKPHGLDREFPIKKIEIPLDNPENTTFTIGDNTIANTLSSTLSNTTQTINSKIDSLPSTTSVLKEAKDNADQIMRQLTNGYITTIIDGTDENAHSEALVISDNVDYTKSNRYWKWNMNGLAYYRNKSELGLALTMDGTIVADRILTGTLGKPEWGNYWNMQTGEFILSPTQAKVPCYSLKITFDSRSKSESGCDIFRVYYQPTSTSDYWEYIERTGTSTWQPIYIKAFGSLCFYWKTDGSVTNWGFKIDSVSNYDGSSYTTRTGYEYSLPTANVTYYTYKTSTAYAIQSSHDYSNSESIMWRDVVIDNITTLVSSSKTLDSYTDSKVSNKLTVYDKSLNQQKVFNKLTNNGQTQGIYLQSGNLYINASYIATGVLSSSNGAVKIDLTQNTFKVNASNMILNSNGEMSLIGQYYNSKKGYYVNRKIDLTSATIKFYYQRNGYSTWYYIGELSAGKSDSKPGDLYIKTNYADGEYTDINLEASGGVYLQSGIYSDIEIRDSGNSGYGYNRLTLHPTGGSGNYVELYSSNSISINGTNNINITTRNFNINGSAGETTDYLWIKNSNGDSRYLKFENGILVDHSWPW